MGNMMKRSKGTNKVAPQQGAFYPPSYGQPVVLQRPSQYRPPVMQMQQQVPYRYASSNEDIYLSNVTGLSPTEIQQLRAEFYIYANPYGIIDRKGFQKIYVASLLNIPWETIDRDAELAFRNFDGNTTGGIDFNEYIKACSRFSGGTYRPLPYQY